MFNLIVLIIKAIASALGLLKNKQQQDAGNANARANEAEQAVKEITAANAARDKAGNAVRDVPSTDQLPDDGFRRD